MKSACRDQARKSKIFFDDVGMIIVLFDWKCVLGASLSCLVFLVEFFSFSLCPNFGLRAPIWLFNTIFGICRPRALILDHKKDLFKHFKWVKTADAATADLIRVVLAEIPDFLCIRSWKGRSTHCQWATVSQSMFGIGEWRFWDIWNDFWKRGLSLEDKSVRIDENRLVERWVDMPMEGLALMDWKVVWVVVVIPHLFPT